MTLIYLYCCGKYILSEWISSQYVLNLSSWGKSKPGKKKKKRKRKIQAWTGIEIMTSAILVQRSGHLVICEFVIYPWIENMWYEYMNLVYLYCGKYILTLFRPGFFEPSLTALPPSLCNLKTVNALVTKLTQDDVHNNYSNLRCFVDMLT